MRHAEYGRFSEVEQLIPLAPDARRAIFLASTIASRIYESRIIEQGHLLAALSKDSSVREVIESAGGRLQMNGVIGRMVDEYALQPLRYTVPLGDETKNLLERALSVTEGVEGVTPLHIMVQLIDSTDSYTAGKIAESGVEKEVLREKLREKIAVRTKREPVAALEEIKVILKQGNS